MLRVPSSINADEFESLKIQDTTFVAYRNNVYPARNEIFFEENAVVYVLEGEKKFVSPTQELYVKKGEILFFRRGYYSMLESLDEEYRSLVFFFNEKLLKSFISQHKELFENLKIPKHEIPKPVLVMESTPTFTKFIESVILYFQHNGQFKNYFLYLKLQELLLHILDLDESNQFKNLLFEIYKGHKLDLEYLMESYYLKPLTINELSQISGRSLSAFKRDFEEQFNTSPAIWIKNKRLEYASFLLQNSTKNVSEISLAIGYESVSHFIKAFKEKYGFTPNKIARSAG